MYFLALTLWRCDDVSFAASSLSTYLTSPVHQHHPMSNDALGTHTYECGLQCFHNVLSRVQDITTRYRLHSRSFWDWTGMAYKRREIRTRRQHRSLATPTFSFSTSLIGTRTRDRGNVDEDNVVETMIFRNTGQIHAIMQKIVWIYSLGERTVVNCYHMILGSGKIIFHKRNEHCFTTAATATTEMATMAKINSNN